MTSAISKLLDNILTLDVPTEDEVSSRVSEYWSWFVVAIFLLIPVDIITTTFAVSKYGIIGEKNWIMVVLLQSEWYVFIFVNLAVSLLAIGMFYGILQMGEKTPREIRKGYYIVVDLWLGLLITFGIVIFANNMTTIVLGRSLLKAI